MPPKTGLKPGTSRKLSLNAEKLYNACLAASQHPQTPKNEFTAEELQAYKVVKELQALLPLCQELHDAQLFIYVQTDASGGGNRLTYRLRNESSASSLTNLDEASRTVYKQIEAAGSAGIWIKHLRGKTQLHQSALTTALKRLEGKNLIKQTKNIAFPGRKLYMLSYLEPTEDATGGPWYNDGEPDTALVETVKNLVVMYIRDVSWRPGPKRLLVDDPEHPERKKLVDLSPAEKELGPPMIGKHERMLLPHPPGHKEYPTATSVLGWINEKGIIHGKDVKVQDVQQLLTVLMYEARIEPMGKKKVALSNVADPRCPPFLWPLLTCPPPGLRRRDGRRARPDTFGDDVPLLASAARPRRRHRARERLRRHALCPLPPLPAVRGRRARRRAKLWLLW